MPGQVEHPLVIEKTVEIVNACLAKGIAVGNFTETPAQAGFWTSRGLRYMSFSVDMGLMYEVGVRRVQELRGECA